jgi:hypothetical protein
MVAFRAVSSTSGPGLLRSEHKSNAISMVVNGGKATLAYIPASTYSKRRAGIGEASATTSIQDLRIICRTTVTNRLVGAVDRLSINLNHQLLPIID